MKRSTMVCLGAMGLVTAGWAVERSMRKPDCPIGPNGQRIITPDCRDPSRSSSSSSSSRSYYYGGSSSNSSGGFWGSSSSHSTAGSAGGGSHAVSSGGWGAIGRAFSSGS